ncbi:MAG: hypothetical protein ACPGU1_01740 [Myxococcota bacterium]
MRLTLTHCFLTLLTFVALTACSQKGTSEPAAAPTPKAATSEAAAKPTVDKKSAEPTAKASDKAPAAGTPSIDSKTKVAAPTKDEEGTEDAGTETEAKAKLAKVYKEIYCAQRRGESEKLLDIYTKNGFEDPETWTKTWTKAAEDGAWVAKTTHDAIRACGDQAPPATPDASK